jgi:hypothetical protein
MFELKHRTALTELYTFVGVLNFNSKNRWCPVLLKLGKQMAHETCDYLLQVWDRKGRCVFERKLKEKES